MKIYSLGSGSSGNSTLLDINNFLLLIDIGLGYENLKSKLNQIGYDLNSINAFLFTHEHIDHIRSIKYANKSRRYASFGTADIPIENVLEAYQTKVINGISITALPSSHDAINPLYYVIEYQNTKLVYVTDTGYINRKNMQYLTDADYYLFESNHDIKMLLDSDRPAYLKNRILSDNGHLSNIDASEYLLQLIGPKTKQIILIHLSDIANDPIIALNTLKESASKANIDISYIKILCASRHEITKGGVD